MAKFILGTKLGMTQVFEDDGTVVPVTVVKVEPNVIVQVKTKEKDGYEAVQVGAGSKRKITKPMKGHLKKIQNSNIKNQNVRWLKEFRTEGGQFNSGDVIDISTFVPGDIVKVTGLSKGKGFAGVMKRHGFHGMPFSHGHHHVTRHGGSIGQRFPQHTLKGMRMAGRTGGVKRTTRGLKVVRVDAENGFLALKGAVPGNNGGFLIIQSH